MNKGENKMHPYCNTGAQNTEQIEVTEPGQASDAFSAALPGGVESPPFPTNPYMEVIIDWCSFTFKRAFSPENIFLLADDLYSGADRVIQPHEKPTVKAQRFSIFDILGIDKEEFQIQNRGMHGYKSLMTYGHINILYDGGADMGVHVQMSGQGCREFENMHMVETGFTWREFMGMVLQMGGSFSRLDLAIDDYRGAIEIGDLAERMERGEVRSKFKTGSVFKKVKLSDGSSWGKTLYFGSSSSRIKIRLYDKLIEMIQKKREVDPTITAWNRTEVEAKDERAQEIASKISLGDEVGEIARGVVHQYLNFCDPSPTDSNKARWKVSEFWLEFLQGAGRLKLASKLPDKSIQRTEAWHSRQVDTSMATMYLAKGERYIIEMVKKGIEKMKDNDYKTVELYREHLKAEARKEKEMRFLTSVLEENQIKKGKKRTAGGGI